MFEKFEISKKYHFTFIYLAYFYYHHIPLMIHNLINIDLEKFSKEKFLSFQGIEIFKCFYIQTTCKRIWLLNLWKNFKKINFYIEIWNSWFFTSHLMEIILSYHYTAHKMHDLSNIDLEKFSNISKFNFDRVKIFMKFYIQSLSNPTYISFLFSKLSNNIWKDPNW